MRSSKARPLILLALLLLAPASLAPGAAAAPRGGLAVLGCISGSGRVIEARGCSTVPGSADEESGLTGVRAFAGGGSGPALYAVSSLNSALVQITPSPSAGRLTFARCFTGQAFIERSCTTVPGAYANADQAPIAEPTAAAISPDGRSLYLLSGSFHGSVIARFSRDPLTGNLAYVDCLTGDTTPNPDGLLACTPIPGATRDGYGSGLNEPSGIAISRDGRRVFVTAALDESLTTFDRDPATGALAFAGCVSGNERARTCRHISTPPRHALEGLGSPLLSPDGKFLYAGAGRTGTIETFKVGGGLPSYLGCIGGGGVQHSCRYGKGPLQALDQPTGLALSPDSRFLYATSGYGSIVVFRRNARTGGLTPISCISDMKNHRRICTLTPNPVPWAKVSVLGGVRAPLLSPDGRVLFAPVRTQDAIVELRRNRRTGALSFLSCATGSRQVAAERACKAIPGATRRGGGSGLHKVTALARGPGELLYAAAGADSTVSVLRP